MSTDLTRSGGQAPAALPSITVVTPCLNAASHIEQTILSVLGQRYPGLQYVVLDGGSTDGTQDVIRRYAAELHHWESRPDGGQAQAINAGFILGTGEVLCWLNADDFLLPGALRSVASEFSRPDRPELVAGGCLLFKESAAWAVVRRPPDRLDPAELAIDDQLDQPSTFWTRQLWNRVGPLDEALHYAMDWDWYLRACRTGAQYRAVPGILSAYRLHQTQKTRSGSPERRRELAQVVSRYASAPWPEVFREVASWTVRSRSAWIGSRRLLWRAAPCVSRLERCVRHAPAYLRYGARLVEHAYRVLHT